MDNKKGASTDAPFCLGINIRLFSSKLQDGRGLT